MSCAELNHETLERAYAAMSDYQPRQNNMVNVKEFKIDVSVTPDIEINIRTRDPCDALAISGALVQALRKMDKEPIAKVLP